MNFSSFVSTSSPLAGHTMDRVAPRFNAAMSRPPDMLLSAGMGPHGSYYLGFSTEPCDEKRSRCLLPKKEKPTIHADILSFFSTITGDSPMIALVLNLGVITPN